MSGAASDLLRRRVLLVTGKGGTGKTSLTAALSLLAAERGLETVALETGSETALPRLLCADPAALPEPDGRLPVRVGPHLHTMRIVPETSLTEYLELQLHLGPVARRIVQNNAFHRFLEAAPGWRELITLGKIWHLQSMEHGGRPRFDLVVVDAPATGHGLSLFSVPGVVLDTVRMGPLRRHTDYVQSMLRDPDRSLVVPVTLAEELPVNETLELCARVEELGLCVGPLVVNAVEPGLGRPGLEALVEELSRLEPDPAADPLADPATVARAARHVQRRAALGRVFVGKLEAAGRPAAAVLPYLEEGVDGPEGASALARCLAAELERARAGP